MVLCTKLPSVGMPYLTKKNKYSCSYIYPGNIKCILGSYSWSLRRKCFCLSKGYLGLLKNIYDNQQIIRGQRGKTGRWPGYICRFHLREDVRIQRTNLKYCGKSPKFFFTPNFIFCSPICSNNCGVVFLRKYILVFEKWLFFVRLLKYANFHHEYYPSCVTSCNDSTQEPRFCVVFPTPPPPIYITS